MKQLLLIRHAKSDWSHEDRTDFDRGLSKRGRRDIEMMIRRLNSKLSVPKLVISSSAQRARTTIELLVQGFGWGKVAVQWEPNLYLASVDSLYTSIYTLPDGVDYAVFCGHNPGLGRLVNDLCGPVTDAFPTLSIALIELSVDSWRDVLPGSGRLLRFDFPKKQEV